MSSEHTHTHTHNPHDEVCMHDQIKFRLGKLCIQCTESRREKEIQGVAMWSCPHSNTVVQTESGIIIQEKHFYNP